MKRNWVFLVALSAALITLQNCKHQPDDTPTPGSTGNTNVSKSDTCSPDTVYFVNDILPILLSNCAQSGCHDAASRQEGVQLTDYDKIIKTGGIKPGNANGSELYEVIVTSDLGDRMPPPPASLTPEQKNAIKIWINQGAKNNHCQNVCDTTNVTFSGEVWPILEATCKGCHSTSPSGGVKITNYSEVKDLVDAGTLQNVLSRKGPRSPMPPTGPLEQCAMDQIRIWIEDGAQDN